MKLKKWLSLALAVVLTAGLLPLTAAAEDEKTLLVLGDSISTGCALENYKAGETPPETAFPVLLTAEGHAFEGYTPIYKAKDGLKADELLALLQGAEDTEGYRAAVAKADVITLTIGGNDLMDLLYTTVTKAADPTPEETTEAEIAIIRKAIETGNTAIVTFTAAVIAAGKFDPTTPEMQAELAAIAAHFQGIIDILKNLNPKATIVVSTQYNPYERLASALAGFQSIPLAQAIVKLSDDMEGTLAAFAQTIIDGQMQNSQQLYKVANAYADFHGSETALCNPKVTLAPFGIQLDFHPNAAGHKQLAASMEAAFRHSHSFTKVNDEAGTVTEACVCGYARKASTTTAAAIK